MWQWLGFLLYFNPGVLALDKDRHFDFMLFAQVWPISSCIEWEERNDSNTCILPNRNTWTVHGIWPTQDHTIGPQFCNRSAHFDIHQLEPILDELKFKWTNVRANTAEDNFWKHEWLKHGTCAMSLEAMNSELKYFRKGLEFNALYPVGQFLADRNILPGYQYTAKDILNAVKEKIHGFNPALECESMKDYVKPVLTQISICLDKNLQLTGCDKAAGGIYGTCPEFDLIEFPASENLNGNSGMIWGIIMGIAIMAAVVIIYTRKRWAEASAYRGYEAI